VAWLGDPASVCEIPVGFCELWLGQVGVVPTCGSLSYHIAFLCFVSDERNVPKGGIFKVLEKEVLRSCWVSIGFGCPTP